MANMGCGKSVSKYFRTRVTPAFNQFSWAISTMDHTLQISLFYGRKLFPPNGPLCKWACVPWACAHARTTHFAKLFSPCVRVRVFIGMKCTASNELHVSSLNKSESITELFEKFCDNRKMLFCRRTVLLVVVRIIVIFVLCHSCRVRVIIGWA